MNKCKNGVLFRTQKIPYCSWQMRNWRLMRSVYIDIPQVDLHNYVMEVMSAPGTVWTKNYYTNIDIKSDLVNVFNGMRRTVGNAYDKPVQRILMYGDSRMYGTGVEDKDTLPSQLQLLLDDHDMQIEVLNMGVRSDVLTNIYERIIKKPYSQSPERI